MNQRTAVTPLVPDPESGKQSVHLNIGQVFAVREPAVLQTLLGSCVSTCLQDPFSKVSGMNHILLPGNADFRQFNESARYGIHAMELLINEMLKLGALRNRLVAKIFGGAHVLAGVSVAASPGQKNVAFVREYLGLEGIRLLSQDTGGTWTRVIRFHTDTFEVFVKRVQSATVRHLLVDEEKFRHQADEQSRADTDITFF